MRILRRSRAFPLGAFIAFLGTCAPIGAEAIEIDVEMASDQSLFGTVSVYAVEKEATAPWTARRVGAVDLASGGSSSLEIAETNDLRLAFAGPKAWGRSCGVESSVCRTRIEIAEPLQVGFTSAGDMQEVEPPEVLVARAWSEEGGSEDLVVCEKVDGERVWSCPRPAGDIDLRFELEGYAPAFVWQTGERDRGDVGPVELRLERGIDIEGWVEAAEGEASLRPSGRRWAVSAARQAFAGYESEVDSDGRVRFEDVGAGSYDLSIRTGSLGEATQRIRVHPGQTRLALGEIELERWERAELLVDPPTDGWGNPWRISLSGPKGGTQDQVLRPSVDVTGYAVVESLTPGLYHLAVRDSRDSTWYLAAHELQGDLLSLSIPHVPVQGRVHAGDTPIVGTLVFGTTQGATSIRLLSDEAGHFDGYLPREGTWEVEISETQEECGTCGDFLGVNLLPPVDVEIGPSGKAILDLALPDTRISGQVVRREDGEKVPVEGAQILAVSSEGGPGRMARRIQLWSDEEGRFEARGVEPSLLEIGATSEEWNAESRWIQVEVREGMEIPEIELMVLTNVELPVRVTAGGIARPGVQVHAFPLEGSSAHGTTDIDGVAELQASQKTSGTLVVDALGYGLHLEPYEVGVGPAPARTVVASSDAGDLLFEGFRAPPHQGTLRRGAAAISLYMLRNFTPSRVRETGQGVMIAGLEPGDYVLCGPQGSPCKQITVPAGEIVSIPRGDWWESAR